MSSPSAATSMLKVASSTSTNTGVAPTREMAPAVAKNVYGVVKTSSPGPISSAISARISASEPDAQPIAYLAPQYAAISPSSFFTSSPKINFCESTTRTISARTSSRTCLCCACRSKSGICFVVTGVTFKLLLSVLQLDEPVPRICCIPRSNSCILRAPLRRSRARRRKRTSNL